LDMALVAARKAIELDPGNAGGFGVIGVVNFWHGKWVDAFAAYQQGLARDPENTELLHPYSGALRAAGYLRESLAVRERIFLLEPLVPLYNRLRAELLAANGKLDDAVKEAERLCFGCNIFVLPAYAQQGRFKDAADRFLATAPRNTGDRQLIDAAAQVMNAAAAKTKPPAKLPDYYSEWNFVYAYT